MLRPGTLRQVSAQCASPPSARRLFRSLTGSHLGGRFPWLSPANSRAQLPLPVSPVTQDEHTLMHGLHRVAPRPVIQLFPACLPTLYESPARFETSHRVGSDVRAVTHHSGEVFVSVSVVLYGRSKSCHLLYSLPQRRRRPPLACQRLCFLFLSFPSSVTG